MRHCLLCSLARGWGGIAPFARCRGVGFGGVLGHQGGGDSPRGTAPLDSCLRRNDAWGVWERRERETALRLAPALGSRFRGNDGVGVVGEGGVLMGAGRGGSRLRGNDGWLG